MKKETKEVYKSTVEVLLSRYPLYMFKNLRREVARTEKEEMRFIQGDNTDEIWELIKLSGGEWKRAELCDAHADFIRNNEPYDFFCTLTFRINVGLKQAKSLFYRFVRKLNENFIHTRYRDRHIPGIRWVRSEEMQGRGVVHFHTLLDHPKLAKASPAAIKRVWEGIDRASGRAEIRRYDPEGGACGYLGKAIIFGGDVEYSEPITWVHKRRRKNPDIQENNSK